MPQLTIALLGPLHVTRAANTVAEFETNPARALLAYLAMHADTPFYREALAALLWPEQPTSQALHALRQTLNRLRSAIGDDKAAQPWLQVTRSTIQVKSSSDFWLDVATFDSLVAATRQHPHRRLECCRVCNQQLRQAVDLYRGDLLAGLNVNSQPFQEWLTTVREQRHVQMIEALEHLADHYQQCGDHDQALHYSRRQIELEPWREEAHRQMMRSLVLSGQRNAALTQYEICRRTLAAELGVEPSTETTRLYQQIRSENLARQALPQSNLPFHLAAFVGREAELTQIAERLQHRDCRLLTLVGLGGMGKSRLAVQVAMNEMRLYRDGVYYVPLATLTLPDQVITSLVRALQCVFDPKQDLAVQLRNYLRRKEMLLILDSFEHVLAAAAQITDLLRHAPGVQALVTSRERLNVQGEWLYEIRGLDYPREELTEVKSGWSAVQLFTETARRGRPDFTADLRVVARICYLVDGMPLAIEFAAAWALVLPCHEIVQEIKHDLDFLYSTQRDVPEQHRSLRVLFDSSWKLLTRVEQDVLRQLSVFRGGFDGVAANAVTTASPLVLGALTGKSWLRQDRPKSDATLVRYGLHDLVQRYTAEQLAAEPEAEASARDRHSHYYATWLQQHLADLKGSAQRAALDEISAEIENVRAAWDWVITRGQIAEADMASESLFLFYDLRGWFQEGASTFGKLAQALDRAQGHPEKTLHGRALAYQGRLAYRTALYTQARDLLQRSMILLQATGARRETAFALNDLGLVLNKLSQFSEARDLCLESLYIFQELGDSYGAATVLISLGQIAYQQGDYVEAQQRCRESLNLACAGKWFRLEAHSLRQLGIIFALAGNFAEAKTYCEQALSRYRAINDQEGESGTLINLGNALFRSGDYTGARVYLDQAAQIKQEIGDCQGQAAALNNLGIVVSERGDYVQAKLYYEQALLIYHEIGDRRGESLALGNLGCIAADQGEWTSACAFQEQAIRTRREISDQRGESLSLVALGLLALRQGDYARAQNYLEQCLRVSREIGDSRIIGDALQLQGLLFHCLGDNETAQESSLQALHIAEEAGTRPSQASALTCLGHALTELGHLEEAANAYKRAIDLRSESGLSNLAVESLAGLARTSMALGNSAQAQKCVTEILSHLETATLDGTEEPVRIYLTCYRVLHANRDPRAQEFLAVGYNFLQERAAKTSSKEMRRSFLENVPAHRELMAEWTRLGGADVHDQPVVSLRT